MTQSDSFFTNPQSADALIVLTSAPPYIEAPRSADTLVIAHDGNLSRECTVSASSDVAVEWLRDGVAVSAALFTLHRTPVSGQFAWGQSTATKYRLEWRGAGAMESCEDVQRFSGVYRCRATGRLLQETVVVQSPPHTVIVTCESQWQPSAFFPFNWPVA